MKKNRTDIIIIQKIFAYYRKTLFDKVSKKYKLLVLHSVNDSGIKQIETNYSKKVKSYNFNKKKDTNVYLGTILDIIKNKPKIVIHEFALGIVSLPFVIIICKLSGIKLILWSHGYDRKKGFNPKKSIADKIRLLYFKLADSLLLYSEKDKLFLSKYIDSKKIFAAQNTFDTAELLKIKNRFEQSGKFKLKKELKIKHRYNLIYIGRLLKSKYPDVLIKIYEKLIKKYKNKLGIHFIGDGELLNQLKDYVIQKGYDKDFYFHGAVYDDNINSKYLFISDLMVLPGALGLSIVHSYCFECPVVSYLQGDNGPYHGPEIDYVINGETGFLAKTDDLNDIVKLIDNYLMNNNLQKYIKNNIKKLVKEKLNINNMFNGIINCIDYCMKK